MTPGKLDTIKPTSSATSLTDGDIFARIVVAFVTNFVAFVRCQSNSQGDWIQNKPYNGDNLFRLKNRFLMV